MTETIKFHDAVLFGEQVGDEVFVPVRPICESIGVHTDKQISRLKSDSIISREHTERYVHDASGRRQKMFCIPLRYVHGWLFSIPDNLVKPEVRPRLLLFKKECYDVLYEHFFGNARIARLDAEREHGLIARNKEINKLVRDLMAEQATNKIELQTILNRRAITYRLEPIHDGAEKEYEKRKFLGQQLKIADT
ncbi:hypothetical protein IC229_05920 [Spirosoma sp. BT702]|uniref:Antirepressor protein ant N-terminal domain-containing protein n=1 Tax=Spirosoma profusum TaxID=2771354 RepID=A0A926XTP9_9BACT|nr:phage antirepressor N-terminal domain-containing protein [Spirosoma profusum]MBD2700163.1 hypothetical protein [Spirosoma profusum]